MILNKTCSFSGIGYIKGTVFEPRKGEQGAVANNCEYYKTNSE
jgi:hypothetical protein